jgi:hypothetical protein
MTGSALQTRKPLFDFHFLKRSRISATAITLLLALLAPSALIPTTPAQTRRRGGGGDPQMTITRDPKNPKRQIITLPKVTRSVPQTKLTQNVLDSPGFRRQPIPMQKFEMVNPGTGKALNPADKIQLPSPDGKPGPTMTVKEYFDQLNMVETELTKRGHTLRDPSTFAGAKPNFARASFDATPKTPTGFKTAPASMFEIRRAKVAEGKSSKPFILGGVSVQPTVDPGVVALAFAPVLYVGEQTSDFGTPEFPVNWAKETLKRDGPKFLFLAEVVDGQVPSAKKVQWQISGTPFQNGGDPLNPTGMVKSGVADLANWAVATRGMDPKKGKKFASFTIDFSILGPPVKNQSRVYYVRAVLLGADGKPISVPSPGVKVNYGMGEPVFLEIESQQPSFSPSFNFQLPKGEEVPFGVYLKGSGLRTMKKVKNTKAGQVTLGFKATADAAVGIRYFNFEHIVNDSAPFSSTLDVLGVSFSAVAGTGTGNGNTNEAQGISLNVTTFGVTTPVPLASVPGVPNAFSLEYDLVQPIDYTLVNTVIFIGPVPIHILATLSGEVGLRLYGQCNLSSPYTMSGGITPYFHSRFNASGGPDILIAYGKLAAELNPLLNVDALLAFDSDAKDPVSVTNSISGLKGRVYLTAGFYHPCPPVKQVKKLFGFITSGECPLCETKWEWTIFDWDGFSDTSTYN